MGEGPVQTSHDHWRRIGDTLVSTYENTVGSSYLDTGMKGGHAEEQFRSWLKRWLPSRVCLESGAILDTKTNPTTQRDVVIFDHHNCGKFSTDGEATILPIEGVLGCIEVNASVARADKIKHDSEKIAAVKQLEPVLPPGFQPRHLVSRKAQFQDVFEEHPIQGKVFGYIFCYDSDVKLETLATHVAQWNLNAGVDKSVDAVFVLKQGYLLHGIETGWTTARIGGSPLYHLAAEPWDVLLTMVSLVTRHLGMATARGYLPEIESYFAPQGGGRGMRAIERRVAVDCVGYDTQPTRFTRLQ